MILCIYEFRRGCRHERRTQVGRVPIVLFILIRFIAPKIQFACLMHLTPHTHTHTLPASASSIGYAQRRLAPGWQRMSVEERMNERRKIIPFRTAVFEGTSRQSSQQHQYFQLLSLHTLTQSSTLSRSEICTILFNVLKSSSISRPNIRDVSLT